MSASENNPPLRRSPAPSPRLSSALIPLPSADLRPSKSFKPSLSNGLSSRCSHYFD